MFQGKLNIVETELESLIVNFVWLLLADGNNFLSSFSIFFIITPEALNDNIFTYLHRHIKVDEKTNKFKL